ncbi:hypothetical protein BD809_11067 [Aquimarina intermedia]|uniref:Uncharacterized protein n=1 Tax=Aquimarina intermedia TaxID=350814 RepID=A0A5S5BXE8_9FLAO|nr:hypothetical protein BD809_11067 [Aquimarina intermedia]
MNKIRLRIRTLKKLKEKQDTLLEKINFLLRKYQNKDTLK